MTLRPEPGLVIRYDYLWKREHDAGRIDGIKDRPCAIIVSTVSRVPGFSDVVVCAITHSPPRDGQDIVEIPPDIARRIGLDDERAWIVTDEVNMLLWNEGRIPAGVSAIRQGRWSYGRLPSNLRRRAFEQVAALVDAGRIAVVPRDTD